MKKTNAVKRVISRTKKPAEPAVVDANGKPTAAKAASPRMYFNVNTQTAIVSYQNSTDKKEREQLYVTVIAPAFERLTENLINIYKFTGLHDSFDDLKNDCVNFMFEAIHKFDPNRGTNAFSYFNVVAKNWLVNKTKQKLQRIKKNVSLDSPEELTISDQNIIDDKWTVPSQDEIMMNEITTRNVIELLHEIRTKVKTENELTCINGIITIFEKIDDVDLVNKNAVLLYMRELTGMTSKQLTIAMQAIKRNYRFLKIDPTFKLRLW